MNNPQQPREYDAVLGGNSPSIEGAAVLGGIEGVKLRLKNPNSNVRIAALKQALNYGEQGLDLVIAGLKDQSVELQLQAYLLLNNRTELKAKQALISNLQWVKLRLQNPDAKVRIAALEQAVNYGEQGLDLVIAGLNDESWDVQYTAYRLLNSRKQPQNKQKLTKPQKPQKPKLLPPPQRPKWLPINQSQNLRERIAEIKQAFNAGEQGLELVIEALKDESLEIQEAAYLLLKPLLIIPCSDPLRLEIQANKLHNELGYLLTDKTKLILKTILIEWEEKDKKWREEEEKKWEEEEKRRLRENAIEEALSKIEDRWLEEEKKKMAGNI